MFGKQTKHLESDALRFQALNGVKEEYKNMYSGFKQNMADKSLARRQNIMKQHDLDYKAEQERWLADRADGMPRDWGTAFKDAGGAGDAAWRVGASAVAGGVAGGVIDGSSGNDSWADGAQMGAMLGGALGAGSFAHSVNRLKVGKYTPVVNGGTSTSYSGPNSVNNNTGTYDPSKAPIPYKQLSAAEKKFMKNNWSLTPKDYGNSIDFS